MEKSKYKKQIGKFSEFCKSKKKQSIKENSQVQIEVPFWDEAIEYAMSEIRCLAGGGIPLNWNSLVEQIKMRFSMLNIYDKSLFTDDSFVTAYVKDILYHNYKDSFISGDTGGTETYSTEEMGTKALVLSKLADAVLQKVKVEAEIVNEPEPEDPKTVATVSLEAGFLDDDFLQYEQRSVVGFDDFTHRLKESVGRIRRQDGGRGLDYCLNKIESVAGSLKLDDIMKVAKKEHTDLKSYLSKLTEGYLKTADIKLNESKMQNPKEQRHVFEQAQKAYSHEIVRRLMEMITKETRKGDEKVK